MPKINVYLPDELAEWTKKAKSLNVSEVCQEALRKEKAAERVIKQLPGIEIDEVIKQYRIANEYAKEEAFKVGIKAGRKWACEGSGYSGNVKGIAESKEIGINTKIEGLWYEDILLAEYAQAEKEWEIDGDLNYELFHKGWVHGVMEIWLAIKDVI